MPNRSLPSARRARPRPRGARAQLLRVGRLLAIWLVGGLLALLVVAGAYTALMAHNRADFNAAIYENYRIVNLPGTTELFRHEGNGRTSYGDNGLVVNKTVNFDVPRLLFVGDSYVEAKQVSDPDKFTELLESDWNAAHADQPIQTLNMGLAGDDLRSYISFGPNMDAAFAPNLVFVMLKQQDLLPLIADPAPLQQWQADPSFRLAKPEKLSPVQQLNSKTPLRQFFLRMLQQTQGFAQTEDSDRKTAQAELNVSGDDMLVGYEGRGGGATGRAAAHLGRPAGHHLQRQRARHRRRGRADLHRGLPLPARRYGWAFASSISMSRWWPRSTTTMEAAAWLPELHVGRGPLQPDGPPDRCRLPADLPATERRPRGGATVIFSSFQFLFFLLAIMALLIVVPGQRARKIVLLVASYYFYAYWDWRFLGLLLLNTVVNAYLGKAMYTATDQPARSASSSPRRC